MSFGGAYHPVGVREETYPKVSAAFLARHGLFSEKDQVMKGFCSHGVDFLVARRRSDHLVFFTDHATGSICQKIYAGFADIGPTIKPYFICPVRNKSCRELLLVGGVWASRQAHGLRTRNGTGHQRRRIALVRQRDKILAAHHRPRVHDKTMDKLVRGALDYLGQALIPNPWIELGPVILAAEQRRRARTRNKLRSKHPEELSTSWAIERGCHAAGSVELGVHLNRPGRDSVKALIESALAQPRAVRRQEEHYCLELKALRSKGLLTPGRMNGWILDWSGLVKGADRVLLVTNLRGRNSFLCLEHISPQGVGVASQTLQLRERPNMRDRLFLECPILGTLHDRLYFRDGFFASAVGQRLKSASQSGPTPTSA